MYPFSTIVGQEDVKEALILNIINPDIGGVLINGPSGTGKSMLVKSLKELTQKKIVVLPLNTSEDRAAGSIDIEKTIKSGRPVREKGILERANGHFLYIDDVNLLPDKITDILLNACAYGEVYTEREGISYRADARFCMIGTMNEASGKLRPSFLDCFGLYAATQSFKDKDKRVEIMRRRQLADSGDFSFYRQAECETKNIRELISQAKKILPSIKLTDYVYSLIVRKILEYNVSGHRADLVMKETVKAVAAFRGHTEITGEDIDEAGYFVLPHRIILSPPNHQNPPEEKEEKNNDNDDNNEKNDDGFDQEEREESGENQNEKESDAQSVKEQALESAQTSEATGESRYKGVPKAFETGEAFKPIEFSHSSDRALRRGSGKRTATKTQESSGRYIYPSMSGNRNDPALDATLRAAAPYQHLREKRGKAIVIKDEDIRIKVRQKKISNLLVFVVDSSGSMGAARRMTQAKGAVLSLLKDAYVKRDKISMVTFSGEGAKVVLPPTGSSQRGHRLLKEIKTGGRTPLNAGIEKGLRVIKNQLRQNPDVLPMLIIITDGRGNVSIDKNSKPFDELLKIGKLISKEKRIESMVIDIENNNLVRFGMAQKLSEAMKAKYFMLDEIKSENIEKIVREEMIR